MRGPLPICYLLFLGAALFGASAWLQRNDIDPAIYYHPSEADAALWLLFYAVIAALFLLSAFRPVPRWALAVAALLCVVEMAVTAPGLWRNFSGDEEFTLAGQSMSADDPRVELSREFFGAMLALGGVALLWWREQHQEKKPDPSGGSWEK